jgi:23S rRNA pseudouridine2605 synthase
LKQLLTGIWLSDGHVKAKSVKRLKTQGESTWLRITLSEGKNREIRRMLARLKHKVMRLRRIAVGPVELGALGKGKSRRLSNAELEALRYATEREAKADKKRKVGSSPKRKAKPAPRTVETADEH